MPESFKDSAEFILPLYINGLSGRMIKASATKKKQREILLIYGHHGMLERWWSLVQNLRPYGNVTMPDMPGFGGMDSFNKIGVSPSIDAYADYLATFVKLRYNKKKITIYAISYGFVVVTRMLQRYPELAGKVDLLISAAGFMRSDELIFGTRKRKIYSLLSRFLATRPVSVIIRYVFLNKFVITKLTDLLPHSKHRSIDVSKKEFEEAMDFEVQLWQANDVRTHWLTTSELLAFDNSKAAINLPIIHIIAKGEQYFNNIAVEQHMRMVFKGYQQFVSKSGAHVPYVTADVAATSVMVPAGLKRLLGKKS